MTAVLTALSAASPAQADTPPVLGWGTWLTYSKVQDISQPGSATGLGRQSRMGPVA
jgi:hypothetical protein